MSVINARKGSEHSAQTHPPAIDLRSATSIATIGGPEFSPVSSLSDRKILMRKYGFSLLLLLTAFVTPEVQAQDAPYFQGNRIFVNGSINGTDVRLLLDTGASHTALFRSSADKLGIVGENPSVADPTGLPLTEKFDLGMFGKEMNLQLPMIDYNPQEPIVGVLSWMNLGARTLMIDGRDRTVSIPEKAPNPKRWQRWNRELRSQQLFLRLTNNGSYAGRLLFDSGAVCGLRVRPEIWSKWRSENPNAPVTLSTFRFGLGDTIVHEITWVREFQLGDMTFYDVALSPITQEEAKKGGREYLGMFGIEALRSMRVLIDRETDTIYTESIPPAQIHNRLGAVFVADEQNGGMLTAHLLPGTPAEEAGLRSGDILVAITGLRALEENAVNQLFLQPAGTQLTLKVKREDGEIELGVQLKDLLP